MKEWSNLRFDETQLSEEELQKLTGGIGVITPTINAMSTMVAAYAVLVPTIFSKIYKSIFA